VSDVYHVPVMAAEVLEQLDPQPGQVFVDATLGGGGHAVLLAERLGPSGLLIGVDQDREAIDFAEARLRAVSGTARLVAAQARFDRLSQILDEANVTRVDGVLFDLGVSSHQLDEPSRGFSFQGFDTPLDMRMRIQSGDASAADLLNGESEAGLTRIFRDNADERWAARIAKFVVERRRSRPFAVAGDLVETVFAAVPSTARAHDTIHPATRVFQALRIAVNDEFGALQGGLEQAVEVLASGARARVLTISYHSGEDRIVKRLFGRLSGRCECPPNRPVCTCGAGDPVLTLPMRKPLVPSAEEIAANPRARSAKLRVAQKR
jgi:16S rRNA (cytosine1402-N4)-methyltransferase